VPALVALLVVVIGAVMGGCEGSSGRLWQVVQAFSAPGILGKQFPFLAGPASGATLASISLLESLIHGWDITHGAHIDYPADDEIVHTVWDFARHAVDDGRRQAGLFADAVPISPTAAPLVALLGHLGRRG
jgi:hypothetical protein